MTTNTDHYLVEETLRGNTQAFSELVARYQDFVFTIAIRIVKVREEAEEVAQDSFIKAFEALSSYRGEAKFSSWLYRIVYRKALDYLRKQKRAKVYEVIEEITEGEMEPIENALEFLQMKERTEIIQKCLEQLPEQESAIITFYYFEELSVKEIAEITKLSQDNIKVKLHRSRKKLFELLKYYLTSEYTEHNGRAI